MSGSSQAMTKLRVLSGEHAGASIDWICPRLKVGPSEELDVYVGDWNVQQIELQRDAEGRHVARWPASDGDASVAGEQREGGAVLCLLEPWTPVRFGAVILCIGPSDEPWPDDAQLLQRCFAPEPPPAPEPEPARRRPPRRRLLMSAAAVPVVVVAACAVMSRPESPALAAALAVVAAARPDPVQRLRKALGEEAVDGLEFELAADRIIVRGVLTSRADVDRLDHALDRLPPGFAISRRFVAVPEIIDRLHESIPGAGLQVVYAGRHRFEISGSVDDLAHANQAVERVAADLVEFGLRIEAALQPRQARMPAMSGMLVDSQGTSFLRTRDGVKHIVPAAAAMKAPVDTTDVGRRVPNPPNPFTPSTSAPPAQENHHASR
jgi:type III secretion protein D